jgi:hypothetical protein
MTKRVPLSGKAADGAYMLVSDEDYDRVNAIRWHMSSNGYAVNRNRDNGIKKTIRAHRFIMNAPIGMDVDHINHNRIDNRRSNLRVCTRSQNLHNKECLGTWFDKRRSVWQVEVRVDKKKYYIGAFREKDEAVKAYREAKENLVYHQPSDNIVKGEYVQEEA